MQDLRYTSWIVALMLLSITGIAQERDFNDNEASSEIQQEKKGFDFSKVYYEGGGGLGYSNGWRIAVDLGAGYKLTKRLSAGPGLIYQYSSQVMTDGFANYNYKASRYGGRLFARYMVWERLFGHVELERLWFDTPYYNDSGLIEIDNGNIVTARVASNSLFVGAGYKFGDITSMNIMLLYNVWDSYYSPYQSALVPRMTFSWNF